MTRLVGILNVTPDSFSDGGLFLNPGLAEKQAAKLFADGADLVDIGAESTRPGAKPLSGEEEWQRLEPVLARLLAKYPGKLSLDTYHPQTAEKALQQGEIIINDVTGMNNPAMVEVVIKHKAGCIISQLPSGNLSSVHDGDLVSDIRVIVDDLLAKAAMLEARGLERQQIILDPGIGFGKTPELNKQLLEFAEYVPDYQVMIGYSRKRFLGDKRMELATNLAAGKIAIKSGTTYLRVHDVAGHRQLLGK